MSRKRLPNSNPSVKRNPGSPVEKTRRTIPENAPVTQKHLGKMTKRVARMESKLKWAMQDYLRYHPKVFPAMWSVLCVIIDLVDFRDGLAYPSTEYIQKKADVKSIRTVDNAVKFAHDHGLIFVQSGGLGGRGLKRSSRYAPNFWLILNRERGEIIRNAAYLTASENWAVVGVNFPADARGCAELVRNECGAKAVRNECGPKQGQNPQKYGTLVRNDCGVQSDNVVGGAPAAPVSANATTRSAPAPSDKESNQREVRYISIKALAPELDMTFEGLIELFTGKGNPTDIEKFDDFCKAQIFTFGKPIAGILKDRLPSDIFVYGHVVIYGCRGKVEFVETGNSNLLLKKKPDSKRRALGPDNWLAIDYRVSPAYQAEAAAKVQELRTGI